ncbi:MAG: cytochrome C [Desulfobulbaceae bacterium S3730MH12]|nr:MAG: cytochrome C [Desulfobulbaceae bacterium S5133MH15]OEU54594.1 MAG: cytochrome C [Desulfobulbaceae bacterium S3730MH12]
MKYLGFAVFSIAVLMFALPAQAVTSKCEECHLKLTPGIVKDFNRGAMSETLTCDVCHGGDHMSAEDADKAKLPTIATCKECHDEQADQYLSGKHAKGLLPITAFPEFAHKQPTAFIAGQKGCNGCHNMGIVDEKTKTEGLAGEFRAHYKYGMDCQNCHTRHAFSKAEAQEPEACMMCHTGFDHAQWEMWTRSKHGSAYMTDREAHRGPTCQDCHMAQGNHRVMTAWGFLAVRLPEKDTEWMGYRASILKALGVLDKDGNPTARLDVVKAADMARLTEEAFNTERNAMVTTCKECHSENYVMLNMENADQMIKAADEIFAEAIELVAKLYQDGVLKPTTNQATFPYPDLLTFYEVDSHLEELLYEMFMDFRMKTYQASFHLMPDYTTWYGLAKMKETLVKMKDLDKHLRM